MRGSRSHPLNDTHSTPFPCLSYVFPGCTYGGMGKAWGMGLNGELRLATCFLPGLKVMHQRATEPSTTILLSELRAQYIPAPTSSHPLYVGSFHMLGWQPCGGDKAGSGGSCKGQDSAFICAKILLIGEYRQDRQTDEDTGHQTGEGKGWAMVSLTRKWKLHPTPGGDGTLAQEVARWA